MLTGTDLALDIVSVADQMHKKETADTLKDMWEKSFGVVVRATCLIGRDVDTEEVVVHVNEEHLNNEVNCDEHSFIYGRCFSTMFGNGVARPFRTRFYVDPRTGVVLKLRKYMSASRGAGGGLDVVIRAVNISQQDFARYVYDLPRPQRFQDEILGCDGGVLDAWWDVSIREGACHGEVLWDDKLGRHYRLSDVADRIWDAMVKQGKGKIVSSGVINTYGAQAVGSESNTSIS
jgi:hypothetical protein